MASASSPTSLPEERNAPNPDPNREGSTTASHQISSQSPAPRVKSSDSSSCPPLGSSTAASTALSAAVTGPSVSQSKACPAGGTRLPRGVSFLCDSPREGQGRKNTTKAASVSPAARYLAGDASPQISREKPSRYGGSGAGGEPPKHATSGASEPFRTLSGILRPYKAPAGALGGLGKAAGSPFFAREGNGGESGTSTIPLGSYASSAPEISEGVERRSGGYARGGGEGEHGEEQSRRRSQSVTAAGGVAAAPASFAASPSRGRARASSNWGGAATFSRSNAQPSIRGMSPASADYYRGRALGAGAQQRVLAHAYGYRGSIRVGSNVFSASPGTVTTTTTTTSIGGGVGAGGVGGGEGGGGASWVRGGDATAGLLYRRSRGWAAFPRVLGGRSMAGRGTFRTCSDSHLNPQHQQLYPRSRKLQQALLLDAAARGGAAAAAATAAAGAVGAGPQAAGRGGSAGSGERGGERLMVTGGVGGVGGMPGGGGHYSYYGRSRSTQQYMGRSAGSLWVSRYSWLPVFSGPSCYGVEWVEYDRQRCFWNQYVADARHSFATRLANHVFMGETYGFYPVCSARLLLWLCLLCSAFFVSMGLWMIIQDEKYLECKLNYEEKGPQNGGSRYLLERIHGDMCGSRSSTEITELAGPSVYVYLEMENVFQNDAQILWSRSWRQLAGEIITDPAELKECEPYVTAVVANETKVLHPCGALAWNVLTDQVHFLKGPEDDDDDQMDHDPIYMNQSQAVVLEALSGWERLYRNPPKEERAKYNDKVYFWMSPEDNDMRVNPHSSKEHARAELIADRLGYRESGPMVENAHFVQWMTAGAFGRWRKLYGKLQGPLKLPVYAYISSVYDVSAWGGKKAIVLVQPSHFGNRTLFAGIAYVVFGCLLMLLSLWLAWKNWSKKSQIEVATDLRWQTRKRINKKTK